MKHNNKMSLWSMAAAAALISFPATAQLAFTPGDVNYDGIVDISDIQMIANRWQDGYGPGDANNDGRVDISDITLIAQNWLKTGPTQAQVIASLPAPPASAYTSGYNASNLQQIGLTQSIAAEGNYGEGVTIGIVDTGIGVTDPQYAGRISPLSACIGCSAGASIDDSPPYHGTVVAGVAAGASPLQIGVAPKATILMMSIQGDINTSIEAAADDGARVINLSLKNSLVWDMDAINYVASKGATIVIAAGNDGKPYFDEMATGAQPFVTIDGRNYRYFVGGIYGFTQEALSHTIVVGIADPSNRINSFSNIPGSDFIGTTGTKTSVALGLDGTLPAMDINTPTGPTATLQSIWLMAPGQVPNVGSGTSYAAPVVAGAVALLDSRWPVLVKNGTTAQVLFASATNLGDPTIYGNGLLNLQAAFQPIGGVSVMTAGGSSVPVNQVVSSFQASGPLGAMQILQAALTNYTVFDSFQRDFTKNLAYLINYKPSSSSAVQAMTAPAPTVSATHFADGSSLSFGNQDAQQLGIDRPMGHAADANWFVSFTDATGSTFAAGQGFPASASFAGALWGSDSIASSQSGSLGIANSLSSIAQGGMFTAFGGSVSKDTRIAFAWTQTQTTDPILGASWTAPNANAMSAGISTHLADGWQAGMTIGSLDEQNGLLGSTYDSNGPLSLGNQNKSMSVGLSSAVKLADKTDLLMEASVARSDGATGSGLIESVTPLYARSYGASLVEHDAFDKGDRIELTAKAPLKVYSGSASLATTSVDGQGNPITTAQSVSLKPNGTELDLGVSYTAPVQGSFAWNASLTARHDADNVAGNTDVIGLVGATYRF